MDVQVPVTMTRGEIESLKKTFIPQLSITYHWDFSVLGPSDTAADGLSFIS